MRFVLEGFPLFPMFFLDPPDTITNRLHKDGPLLSLYPVFPYTPYGGSSKPPHVSLKFALLPLRGIDIVYDLEVHYVSWQSKCTAN